MGRSDEGLRTGISPEDNRAFDAKRLDEEMIAYAAEVSRKAFHFEQAYRLLDDMEEGPLFQAANRWAIARIAAEQAAAEARERLG